MGSLGMIDHEQPPSKVCHVVEDPREHSGHMQICHRSPMTGYFQPTIQLGDPITAGKPLGIVCDLVGERRETVLAEQTGLVIVLKTFPRVLEDEALAVILETDLELDSPGSAS
jgi:predicted deacylase